MTKSRIAVRPLLALLFALPPPVAVAFPLTPSPALQEEPSEVLPRVVAEEHEARVFHERLSRFLEAWETTPSGERGRAFAAEVLRRGRHAGTPAARIPSLPSLCEAQRLLERDADPGPRISELQRFADGLDLRAVPGISSANAAPGELTEPVTVHVAPLWDLADLAPAHDFELLLEWISPDGARSRARREPVEVAAVRPGGFRMYLRAPSGLPGTWRLAPTVIVDGERAEGVPVCFEVVEALEDVTALALAELQGEARARLERELELARRYGIRARDGRVLRSALGLEDSVTGITPRQGAPAEWPAAARTLLFSGASLEEFAWHLTPTSAPIARVLLAAPPGERAVDAFAGPRLAGWLPLVDRGVQVVSVSLPFHARGSNAPSWPAFLESLTEGGADAPVPTWLVARGEQTTLLTLELRSAGVRELLAGALAGLVLETVETNPQRAMAPRIPDFGGVPGLVLTAEATGDPPAATLGALPEGWSWVRSPRPLCLAESQLPGLLGGLLAD